MNGTTARAARNFSVLEISSVTRSAVKTQHAKKVRIGTRRNEREGEGGDAKRTSACRSFNDELASKGSKTLLRRGDEGKTSQLKSKEKRKSEREEGERTVFSSDVSVILVVMTFAMILGA